MKSLYPNNLVAVIITVALLISSSSKAQELNIYSRSNLVMNGNVFLVVNNAAFKNNGTFSADISTVKFSGNADTTTSYIGGSNTSTFYNLTSAKGSYGTAAKSPSKVENVFGVTSGNFYTDSNLTLLSTANLTARVDVVPSSCQIVGKAMIERYVPARRSWRIMTAPATSANNIFSSWQNNGTYTANRGMFVTGPGANGAGGNGLDVSPQNNVSMKSWNYTSQAFVNVTNTYNTMSGTNGSADNYAYFTFVRGDRTYNNFNYSDNISGITTLTSIGKLQTGNQTFSCSTDSAKYTMIGNPYASPVDFNKVTLNNVVKRIIVWDPNLNSSLGGWVALDDIDGDGVFTSSVSGSSMTQYIQSSQGFFVQTSGKVSSASVVFTESCKASSNNSHAFRPAGSSTESIRTNLYLDDNGSLTLADGILAEYNTIFNAAVDLQDAPKFTNMSENLGFYRSGKILAIERRPIIGQNDTLYLRLSKTTQRAYQFEFVASALNEQGRQGVLIDNYSNTSTPLSLDGSTIVKFTVDGNAASSAVDRFMIVFNGTTSALPVTISSVKATQQNNNVVVEWKVENEINMKKYDVEKSNDGIHFTTVGSQNAAGLNTNTYSWIDANVTTGNIYYRIESYDNNGDIKFTSVVKVTIGEDKASGFSVYPNVITGSTINLAMNNQNAGVYQVRLVNTIGQVIYENSIQHNGGSATQQININKTLMAGMYKLEIVTPNNTRSVQSIIAE